MATSIVSIIKQSPAIDPSVPYDTSHLQGKTILVTGGASGFGAAFVRHWATHGASCIIIGDIDVAAGTALERSVRKELEAASGPAAEATVHFVHCDVRDWQSQVHLFREAARLSPHGGIDVVVANAGIARADPFFSPVDLDKREPPKPDFSIIDVNFTGALYTAHLAFHYLPLNPKSPPPASSPQEQHRYPDRHLLLVGSVASLGGLAAQPQYTAAKHAVMGLFRSLTATAFPLGIRVNILCPYFISTPLVPATARMLLAGGATGKVEDVVDAATRLVADERIAGRGLAIARKVRTRRDMDGSWVLAGPGEDAEDVVERAVWDCTGGEWEDCEMFCRRFVRLLNGVEKARGWAGWAWDLLGAVGYGLTSWRWW